MFPPVLQLCVGPSACRSWLLGFPSHRRNFSGISSVIIGSVSVGFPVFQILWLLFPFQASVPLQVHPFLKIAFTDNLEGYQKGAKKKKQTTFVPLAVFNQKSLPHEFITGKINCLYRISASDEKLAACDQISYKRLLSG